MGKKHKLLRIRYFTDITSRWKTGAGIDELEWKFAEYKREAEPSATEYAAFVKSVEDCMYETEAKYYEEALSRKRASFRDILYYARMVPYANVQSRLVELIKQWKKKSDDDMFNSRITLYESFLLQNAVTVDEIRSIIADQTGNERLRRRLFSWIEKHAIPITIGKIANDKQNIHTTIINKQTKDILSLLQAVVIPSGQKTMSEILSVWPAPYEIEFDMRIWANKPSIVNENDYLYRNTLRSVWAKIKLYDAETRKELIRRLGEECAESVGMCAQGHISRLVNVFVGFDDQFLEKELFQDKMAKISNMTLDKNTKVTMASKIMDEENIDKKERQSWLEAFDD